MSMRICIGLCISLAALNASAKNTVCPASKDTVEDIQCLSAEIEKADKKLANYLLAATTRLAQDATLKLDLSAAQHSWIAYRQAQCGDVYAYWQQGSYRHRASAQCMLDLTQQRTHDIWSAYLTHADSTPAVLSEP